MRAKLSLNDIEQRRLTSAICTQKAVSITGADHPSYLIEHFVLPVGERGIDHINALLPQSRNSGTLKFCSVTKRGLFCDKGTRRFNMKTRLAGSSPGTAGKKCQLAADKVLSLLFRHLGLTLTLHTLKDVGGIAAFEWLGDAIVHFPHAKAYFVEEPAVVGYHHQGTSATRKTFFEVLCQPVDGNHVKVVGGLVKQQHVSIGDQHTSKVNATTLTARKRADLFIPVQIADHAIDDIANARIGRPFVFGHIAHHVPSDGFRIIEFIYLTKRSKANTARS